MTCLFVFQIGFSSASSRCEVSALRAENRFERKKKQTNKLSTRLKWNKQIKVEQQTSNAPEIKDEGKRRPICAICNPLYIFLAEFKNCSSVKYESQRRNLCSLCSLGFHYGRKGERLIALVFQSSLLPFVTFELWKHICLTRSRDFVKFMSKCVLRPYFQN